MTDLLPIEDAWVCRAGQEAVIGRVSRSVATADDVYIDVDFGPKGKERLRPGDWGCGLRTGFTVQDVPLSGVRVTMGMGTVRGIRELATRHQALVQFHRTGETIWLPFEQLRRVMDPALRFRRSEPCAEGAAERLALNVIAHLLKSWNEATGALDRLDVDPLPHQIGLVHRIINSGQTNWLIADDVGLGKTIEVGLLLAALERRQNIRRILIVVPSGLTQQWKEEMLVKFDRQFLIYGVDFRASDPREWGLYERVIVSLDYAKPKNAQDDGLDSGSNFGMLMAAGNWDIVIFDEAHRLSRNDAGRSTLRFRLAQGLRSRTDALILLTGTPHQGDQGKFRNLLALVRPDLTRLIQDIDDNPAVVREIILRNRKIDAVDIDGSFLFRGVLVRRVEVETDAQFTILESRLRQYLSLGYGAGNAMGGAEGRAVGFVMTIYRKLASSSVAALWISLRNRLERLSQEQLATSHPQHPLDDDETEAHDDPDQQISAQQRQPFFDGEELLLKGLIELGKECVKSDKKGEAFVEIIRDVVQREGKKVVVFTEYRSTQAYLVHKIEELLGSRPALIRGGMSVDDKRNSIRSFEEDLSVLISTEAGGEGLNLHRNCHVLINYDLPWNPARLTQRIGRIYRYGQNERVVVINFHARDTIDNEIVSTVLDRVDTIVREMQSVGPEFDHLYAAEVMGELLERVDISALLEEARTGHVERTQERIDAALAEAGAAKRLQDDILSEIDCTGTAGASLLQRYTTANVATFIRRAAGLMSIEIEPTSDPERFTIRLPPDLRGAFREFGNRSVISATTRRKNWRPDGDVSLIDFSGRFLNHLVETVTAPAFGGSYAVLAPGQDYPAFFAIFLARYQNDQGQTQGDSLIVIEQDDTSGLSVEATFLQNLLSDQLRDASPIGREPQVKKNLLDAARDRAEIVMSNNLTSFRHPNDLVTLAIAERGTARDVLGIV